MSYLNNNSPPSGYSYLVRFIKDKEIIAVEEYFEKPDEDQLRKLNEQLGSDFYDICRSEPTF